MAGRGYFGRDLALAVLLVVVVAPRYATIALVRLANPMSNTAWPQSSHLAFTQSVSRIALGGRFEVELVDASGAPLPREVRIHYRFEGEPPGERASR